MGLFSKKKQEKKEELPPLKFPNFPEESFPTYESEVAEEEDIKPEHLEEISKEFQMSEEHYEPEPIPKQEPEIVNKRQEDNRKVGKALFVKVDKYKKALTMIDAIKVKLEEAEKAILKLDELKKREDAELQSWKEDLEELKAKLLDIDKELFE